LKSTRLAIDFDGVLNSYTSGYKLGDDSYLPDPPVDGALEFIQAAIKVFDEVIICTTRARSPEGVHAIKEWLEKYGFPTIKITQKKCWATVYLDDRGVTFTGVFPKVEALLKFKTWMEKKGE